MTVGENDGSGEGMGEAVGSGVSGTSTAGSSTCLRSMNLELGIRDERRNSRLLSPLGTGSRPQPGRKTERRTATQVAAIQTICFLCVPTRIDIYFYYYHHLLLIQTPKQHPSMGNKHSLPRNQNIERRSSCLCNGT